MLSGALFDRCTPAIPSDDDGWVFFGDPDRVHVIRLTDDILWVRRAHLVAFTAVLACDTDPEPLIDEAVRLRPVRLSGTGSVAVMTATVPTVVTVHRTPTYVDLDTIVGSEQYATLQADSIAYGYSACGTWPETFVAQATHTSDLSEQIASTTWHLAQQFLCDTGSETIA